MTYIEEGIIRKLNELVKLFGKLEYKKVEHRVKTINKHINVFELRLMKEEMTNKIMLNKFMEPLILDDFLYEQSSFEYTNDDLVPDKTKVNKASEILDLIKESGIYTENSIWFNILNDKIPIYLDTLNSEALREYFRNDFIVYAILNDLDIPYVDIRKGKNVNIRADKLLVDTDGVFDKVFNTEERDFIRRKLRQSWF